MIIYRPSDCLSIHHFLKIFLVLSPFLLDPDPYQSSPWIRIRNEFFHILDPDPYQNDTDPQHCQWVTISHNPLTLRALICALSWSASSLGTSWLAISRSTWSSQLLSESRFSPACRNFSCTACCTRAEKGESVNSQGTGGRPEVDTWYFRKWVSVTGTTWCGHVVLPEVGTGYLPRGHASHSKVDQWHNRKWTRDNNRKYVGLE